MISPTSRRFKNNITSFFIFLHLLISCSSRLVDWYVCVLNVCTEYLSLMLHANVTDIIKCLNVTSVLYNSVQVAAINS